jgi:hypothetical protein
MYQLEKFIYSNHLMNDNIIKFINNNPSYNIINDK